MGIRSARRPAQELRTGRPGCRSTRTCLSFCQPLLDPKKLLQRQFKSLGQLKGEADRWDESPLLHRDDRLPRDANPLGELFLRQEPPMPMVPDLILEPAANRPVKFALHHTTPLRFVNLDGISVTYPPVSPRT